MPLRTTSSVLEAAEGSKSCFRSWVKRDIRILQIYLSFVVDHTAHVAGTGKELLERVDVK